MYYLIFVSGNDSILITKDFDREKVRAVAIESQKELKAEKEKGVIVLYRLTLERGKPLAKCFEFWEV